MAVKKVFRNHPVNLIIASLFILAFVGFEFWDHYIPPPVQDRNQREISRITVDPADFSFAVFGDHKGHDAHFEPLLHDVSRDKQIAFAIELGDLLRKGRKWFYRRFLNQLEKNISIPFLTAIGNHDLYRGSGNYREIFGPTHYSFQIGQVYFIILDTSARFRFDKAQRQWLETELQKSQSSRIRFVLTHVPLFDPRGRPEFVKCLSEKDGKDLLDLFRRYHVTHFFASHIHGYFSGTWDGVPYTITGGAGAGLHGKIPQNFFHHYIKVHVAGDQVRMEVRPIEAKMVAAKNFLSFLKDFGPEWGLFAGSILSLLTLGFSIQKDYRKSKQKSV
jgi:hypothetical protein